MMTTLMPQLMTVFSTVLLVAAQGRSVSVVAPARADIGRETRLIGTVLALQEARIVPRVTGYLEHVGVLEGDRLELGAEIARIAVPELAADRARALAAVAEAEAFLAQREAGVADAEAGRGEAQKAVDVMRQRVLLRTAEVAVAEAEIDMWQISVDRKRALVKERAATVEELQEAEGRLAKVRAAAAAARASIAMAEAEVAAAEAREQAAVAAVRSARAAVDSAQASIETARAEVQRVETRVGFASLVSPYASALVTRRHVDEGALVRAGETAVVTVMDVSRVRVLLRVPERDAPRMRAGLPVSIEFDSGPGGPGEPIEATITRTSGVLDESTRTMRCEAWLDNEAGRFMPGMFCHARLVLERSAEALVLPGSAVRADAEGTFVFVVEDGVVRVRRVALGIDDGLRVEVLEGLAGGEQVVNGNVGGLRDGERVRAVAGAGR